MEKAENYRTPGSGRIVLGYEKTEITKTELLAVDEAC